jgi:hypothetical protein
MNLEKDFKKETGYDPYIDNNLEPKIPMGYYVEWLESKIEQLILSGVVGQSEQLCEGLHSTDFNGKCFKCGEQVFVREPK